MQKANKPDRLEKEIEKYVIRTLRNTHNTEGGLLLVRQNAHYFLNR